MEKIHGGSSRPVRSICVIGAGPSGLVTCKTLKQAGFDVDVFEAGSREGGTWNIERSQRTAYQSLHANTSKKAMAFADFDLPDTFPTFPNRAQIQEYLALYVGQFNIRSNLNFNTTVEQVKKEGDQWSIWFNGMQKHSKRYDAVVVCSGQFQYPQMPSMPNGSFDGQMLHAQNYLSPSSPYLLADKRVVVVGMGTSALDIATELASEPGCQVWISARSGRYLAPKMLKGKPLDIKSMHPSRPLPGLVRLVPRRFAIWVSRKAIQRFYDDVAKHYGSSTDLGFPQPDYHPWEKPPTITADIRPVLKAGKIRIKPGISSFKGQDIHFTDDTVVTADAIIFGTGYRWEFPFLTDMLAQSGDDASHGENLKLERRIAHPKIKNLFFVGFCKQLCSIFPLAEQQAKWLAGKLIANPPTSCHLTTLSKPLGTICNFYVDELLQDQRHWNSKWPISPRPSTLERSS